MLGLEVFRIPFHMKAVDFIRNWSRDHNMTIITIVQMRKHVVLYGVLVYYMDFSIMDTEIKINQIKWKYVYYRHM